MLSSHLHQISPDIHCLKHLSHTIIIVIIIITPSLSLSYITIIISPDIHCLKDLARTIIQSTPPYKYINNIFDNNNYLPQTSTVWSTWRTPASRPSWGFLRPSLPQLLLSREEISVRIAGLNDIHQDDNDGVFKKIWYWWWSWELPQRGVKALTIGVIFYDSHSVHHDLDHDSRIAETSVAGVYQLELERLAKCGVRTIFFNRPTNFRTIFFGQLFQNYFLWPTILRTI